MENILTVTLWMLAIWSCNRGFAHLYRWVIPALFDTSNRRIAHGVLTIFYFTITYLIALAIDMM